LAAGLCPDPLGELVRSPDIAAVGDRPSSKGRKGEGEGMVFTGYYLPGAAAPGIDVQC